jgi:hypothetical protein
MRGVLLMVEIYYEANFVRKKKKLFVPIFKLAMSSEVIVTFLQGLCKE